MHPSRDTLPVLDDSERCTMTDSITLLPTFMTIALIVGGLVVLSGIVTLIVVLAARRRKQTTPAGPE